MKTARSFLVSLLVVSVMLGCLCSAVSFADPGPVSVGDIIPFGKYNSVDKVEWRVLEVDGNEALLISKNVLDRRAYHENEDGATWDKSDLRAWLNDEFLNTAFTAEEQEAILVSTVDNSERQANPYWNMFGDPIVTDDTADKVFVLSYQEAQKYFKNDNTRAAETVDDFNNNGWWLRSPGFVPFNVMWVKETGEINDSSSMYCTSTVGVRPVIRVDVDVLSRLDPDFIAELAERKEAARDEEFETRYKTYIDLYRQFGRFADLSALSLETQEQVRAYVDGLSG